MPVPTIWRALAPLRVLDHPTPHRPPPHALAQVTFDIDANGILSVSASERTSGRRATTTIKNSDRLSDDEISRMVREAEQYR